MLNDAGGTTIDLGAGNNTLNLTVTGGVTVVNVEHVNGSAATDFITDAGVVGTTTITGGGGAGLHYLDIATDIIRYTDASDSRRPPAKTPSTISPRPTISSCSTMSLASSPVRFILKPPACSPELLEHRRPRPS